MASRSAKANGKSAVIELCVWCQKSPKAIGNVCQDCYEKPERVNERRGK